MLTIRREQMDALDAQMTTRFIRSAGERCKRRFPDQVPRDPAARDTWARVGTERALAHGFLIAEEVHAYLDCLARFGPDFDRAGGRCPWAERLFQLRDVLPADKATVLNHYLAEAKP